jgi:integrase
MAGKLTARGVESLSKRKGRYLDGNGLFMRVLGPNKSYWVYRYRVHGVDREMSIGNPQFMTLVEARAKHLEMRAIVAKGGDPVGERQKGRAFAKVLHRADAPTFGEAADAFLDWKDKLGKFPNRKHRWQWGATLAGLPASFRAKPVAEITVMDVFAALEPIWAKTPETASRLRGRIAAVIDKARGPEDERRNPAAWSGWLKTQLGSPKELGKIDRKTGERVERGNHTSMPYQEVPAFMARLKETPGVASLALQSTILCALRTSEVLDMIFDEIDFERAILNIDGKRMKMGKPHRVPLSDAALAILKAQKAQYETRGKNPYVFPGRPMKPLSNMSMAMLLRRMKCEVTVHGFRSSFRDWATEVDKTEYATAERCLAHAVGSDAALSYDRSDRLDLRRPVMQSWSDFVTGSDADNVVPLRAAQ